MNLMSVKGRCCVDYVGIEGDVTGLDLDDSCDACTSDLRWCIDTRVMMWQDSCGTGMLDGYNALSSLV
jgi:hypothetical protein